tara:strand:+ start:886 stop:1194 length:309 start_codon:yes stop_codon:yes gene_type:complete
MKIIDTYKITYENGVVQWKNLISHIDYLNIIKSIQSKIGNLEIEDYKKNKDKIKALKDKQISLFGEHWFTDNSPLFWAVKTGEMTLPILDKVYNYKVKLNKL